MEIIKLYFISLVFINFIKSLAWYTLKYFKLESGIVAFYCVSCTGVFRGSLFKLVSKRSKNIINTSLFASQNLEKSRKETCVQLVAGNKSQMHPECSSKNVTNNQTLQKYTFMTKEHCFTLCFPSSLNLYTERILWICLFLESNYCILHTDTEFINFIFCILLLFRFIFWSIILH